MCLTTATSVLQFYTWNLARPNYSKADWSGICCFLSAVNWYNVFHGCNSVEQYWDAFAYVVDECVKNFILCYSPTVHTANVKHYPNYVRKLFHKKHLLWKLYRQFRSNELLAKYKQASQLCSNSIVDFIAQHENNLIDNGKLGNFFTNIGLLTVS